MIDINLTLLYLAALMKNIRYYIITIIIVILTQNNLYADDVSKSYYNLREKEIYRFSLDLFQSGEYYRAITEAKRYISVFPVGKNIEDAHKLIGDSYLMSKQWSDAIHAYDKFIIKFPTSQFINNILFNKAICLVKKKEYSKAAHLFQGIIDSSESWNKDESILWKILLLIQENKFEEIEKLLDDRIIKQQLREKISIIERTIYVKKNMAYKSPKLAGIMSAILPGSGQFYNERYKDGIYSFILNALFTWGAYKSFENDNPAVGGILSIFEIGWYTGNIYSAASGSHKYNRKIDEDIFKKSIENFELLEHEIRKTPDISIIFRFYF